MLIALVTLAVGAATYFGVSWLVMARQYRSMTRIEQREAIIKEQAKEQDKKPLPDRVRLWLNKNGWNSQDLTPPIALIAFLYLGVTGAAVGIGLNTFFAPLLALPASVGIVATYLGRNAARRRLAFNRQLFHALQLVAGQIEAGSGAQRALEQITPNLQDPLRSELTATLNKTVASKDLIAAMRELEERYPSRALTIFINALEIDRDKGGSIAPALREAADVLQADFELSAEAKSELATTKAEFYGVIGVIGTIIAFVYAQLDPSTYELYLSPLGIALQIAAGGWFALGVTIFLRTINRAGGDY